MSNVSFIKQNDTFYVLIRERYSNISFHYFHLNYSCVDCSLLHCSTFLLYIEHKMTKGTFIECLFKRYKKKRQKFYFFPSIPSRFPACSQKREALTRENFLISLKDFRFL